MEFLMVGESRPSKIRRDYRKSRVLFKQGIAELRASGAWKGSPRTKMLKLIDWYQARTECRTCRETPQHSFSHKVSRVVATRGAVAGMLAAAGLLFVRTMRREPDIFVR